MEEVLLSYIIPAYNAEGVLRRAVESIVRDYEGQGIEILIVENGSSDQTLPLAEALGGQYAQVRVFRSPKGVSAARNLGIKEARGRYLSFVDADDYLPQGSVKGLLEENLQEPDLVIGGYQKGSRVVDTAEERKQEEKGRSIEEIRAALLKNPTKFMAVWGKAFRRQLIEEHSVYFNEELTLAEDGDFMLRYTRICRKIAFSEKILYYYNIEDNSTVRSYDDTKVHRYTQALYATGKEMQGETEAIQRAYDKYILIHLSLAMVHGTFSVQNPLPFRQKVSALKETVKQDVYQRAICRTRIFECKSIRMLPTICLKFHMYMWAGILYRLRGRQKKSK